MLEKVKLSALPIEIMDGDRGKNYPKKSEFLTEGIPFLNSAAISDGRIDFAVSNYISEQKFKLISKGRVKPNDIILTTRGNGVGKVAIFSVNQEYPEALINAQMLVIRAKQNEINPDYLFYLIKSSLFQDMVQKFSSGSAQPQLPIKDLKEIPVPVLPFSSQKAVGDLLKTYDNLIENNNRRIAILEEMAQSLYREWFVKFRFPGHDQCQMVESPLGLIPEGWEVRSIGELYKTSSGGTPSRKKSEYYGEDHWWVKTKELKDNFVISVDEKISDLGLQKSSAKLFPKHTAVIAMYGATIGRLGLLSEPAATNQACCALIQTHDAYSSWFAYLMLFFNRKKLISLGQGAAQQNISQAVIKAFTVITPPEELLNLFNSTVEPLFLSIENLSKKNNNLKAQRDLLLPKLISGQIDLSKAEQASA